MGKYEDLVSGNLVKAIKAMGLRMGYDGKVNVPYHLELETPWIEQGACPDRECLLWKDIIFENFRVIHPGCMSCWKIYYFPETVEELFDVYEQQKSQSFSRIVPSCKCGIETRGYSGHLGGYAAFWYNPLGCGLKQARENTKRLSELYQKELRLKRGCTEMEQFTINKFGADSTRWNRMIELTKEKLERLEDLFIVDTAYRKERRPEALRRDTEQRWIEYAAQHGDQTYLKFTDGKLVPELKTYHGSIDTEKEIDDGFIWKYYLKHRCQDSNGGESRGEKKVLIANLEEAE